MTSITAQTHATLDGVIDAPPADALLPYMSDAGRQGALDLALAADALLLPRETWQGLARAWRDQTGPMAERLNAMPKYVVSATLGAADEWDHTTIVGYDDIAGLREREQLLTYGCGRLARDLLADGLLDVLVLSLTPVVAGAGRRLFDDPATSSGCGSPTARPSRPAPCGCSLSRIKSDRSYNRVLLSTEAVAEKSWVPVAAPGQAGVGCWSGGCRCASRAAALSGGGELVSVELEQVVGRREQPPLRPHG